MKMSEKRRRRRRRGKESCERVKTSDREAVQVRKTTRINSTLLQESEKVPQWSDIAKKKKKTDDVKKRDVGGVKVGASSLTSQINTLWDN